MAAVVLARFAMSVAGRPLTEDQLATVTGLGADAVRAGLRELDDRSLAETAAGGRHRVRHALLAEAAAARLLPGERRGRHERLAATLQAGGDALAAEAADHWAAAGRDAEELPARLTAARAAEQVCGYAEAAAHWQRAIELASPDERAGAAGVTFVKGADFCPGGAGGRNSARLAYSFVSPTEIDEGVERLAAAVPAGVSV